MLLWRWVLLKLLTLVPGCHEELAGSVQKANCSQQHTFALKTSRERVPSSSRSAYSVHLGLYMLSFIMRIFSLFLVAGSPAERWHTEKCSFGWPRQLNFQTRAWFSTHELILLLFLFTALYKHHYLWHVSQPCVKICVSALLCVCSVGSPGVISRCRHQQNCAVGSNLWVRIRDLLLFMLFALFFHPFWCSRGNNVLEVCVGKGAGVRDSLLLPLRQVLTATSPGSLRPKRALMSMSCLFILFCKEKIIWLSRQTQAPYILWGKIASKRFENASPELPPPKSVLNSLKSLCRVLILRKLCSVKPPPLKVNILPVALISWC